MGAGMVNQGLASLQSGGDCLLGGDIATCIDMTVPVTPLINTIGSTYETGASIYTEYKQGDGAHATGRIGAFALVAILTKGACKSFTPDTPVLLSNGKSKPIGKIKLGDKVTTADPKTGKRKGIRAVSAVWINHDYDLVDLRVRQADGTIGVLHTTAKHLIWDDTLHKWAATGKLAVGHALNTDTNQHVRVVSVTPRAGDQYMYNLTVNDLHTYYVLAGATQVLVHNCGNTPAGVGCTCASGTGAGPADSAIRNSGPWTRSDIIRGSLGLRPNQLGDRIEIHHADQMPGSPIHELDQEVHRGAGTDLHRNKYPGGVGINQGVSSEMRTADTRLHWWYRSQEQGWGTYTPEHWFENWPG
ncbi:hypothetical protein J2X68_007219 [Streptomyces sp. 3330]|uniref:Hint domain-containing protein n=1 Tax=Streptomyces sp. 3330 TaxID=2817755 RepID=UPI00285FFA88|nr:Hint domain-containing protein [Streptomyces sp. 3330]MDR6980479.1 hypothetical protein [Streptomyces sp. 3330]